VNTAHTDALAEPTTVEMTIGELDRRDLLKGAVRLACGAIVTFALGDALGRGDRPAGVPGDYNWEEPR